MQYFIFNANLKIKNKEHAPPELDVSRQSVWQKGEREKRKVNGPTRTDGKFDIHTYRLTGFRHIDIILNKSDILLTSLVYNNKIKTFSTKTKL